MAGAVGGDVREARFTHPTLGTGVFYPKANEGNTFDPGGYRQNDDANQRTVRGRIKQLNAVNPYFEMVVENDMNGVNDAQVAANLSGDPVDAVWTISLANGTVWSGSGSPVGDIQPDLNASTFTLKVAFDSVKKL